MQKPTLLLSIAMCLSFSSHASSKEEMVPNDAYELLKDSSSTEIRKRAEKWHELTRTQDWVDHTGHFKVKARYVDHAHDLSWVRLETARFEGSRLVRRIVEVRVKLLAAEDRERVKSIAGYKPVILADLDRLQSDHEPERTQAEAESVRTKAQQEALDSFGYEGVTFDTTLTEFMTRYPELKNIDDDALSGSSSFFLSGKDVNKSFSTIHFGFLDGKLMSISLWYESAQIEQLGGVDALKRSLRDKFGRPDAERKHEDGQDFAVWQMTAASLGLSFTRKITPNGETIRVSASDVLLMKERLRRAGTIP